MSEPARAGDVTRFEVYGDPAPQGSKDGIPVARKGPNGEKIFTGQVVMLESSRETLDPWRAAVEKAAKEALRASGRDPFLGAVSLGMGICLKRKKTVTRKRPSVRPDISKLIRAVEDAITDSGLWGDDALVTRYSWLEKTYAGGTWEDGSLALTRPGAVIQIVALEDNPSLITRKRSKPSVPRPAPEPSSARQSVPAPRSRLKGPITPVEPSPALLEALRVAGADPEAGPWA